MTVMNKKPQHTFQKTRSALRPLFTAERGRLNITFLLGERRPIARGCFQNMRLNKRSVKTGVRTVTKDIDWIFEFERLARPRLQKIFEKRFGRNTSGVGRASGTTSQKGGVHASEGYKEETTMKKRA